MGKYIDGSGLSHFMGILKGIHQTFVTNVKWDSSTKKIKQTKNGTDSDVMQFVQGSNVTLTAASGSLTIAATDTTYSAATTSTAGLMSAADKTKLNGIATGAEVNQNAFSTVHVGTTDIAADGKTDTLELAAGSNITLTPDATNDKVTIATLGNFGAPTSNAAGTDGFVYGPPAGGGNYTLFGSTDWAPLKIIEGYDPQNDEFAISIARGVPGTDQATVLSTVAPEGFITSAERTKLNGLKMDGVGLAADGSAIHYGACSTAAGTVPKAVSCSNFTLVTGAWIAVKFTVTNTAAVANLTLSVNSTTAKPIKYRGANLSSAGVLAANRTYLFVYDGTNYELVGDLDTNSDTKNTAGSTDSSSKLFLIGATSQAANPQTYSQDTAYVGTDGHLYSNSKQVVNLSDEQALTNKTYNGLGLMAASAGFVIAGGTTSKTLTVSNSYTLGAACEKGVDTSIAANSTSTNVPTTKAVVEYIGQVAGALVYKGTVSAESSLLNVALKTGWFYIVTMPNTSTSTVTIGGVVCEAGDMIIVNTAGTYTTSSALGTKIDVVQTNIETLSNSEIDSLWTAATAA